MSALHKIGRKYHVVCRKGITLALAFFLTILLTTNYLLPTVYAQDASPSASILPTTNYQLPTTISPTSPAYTDLIVHNMFHTFSCLTVGGSIIGQPCLTYQIQKDAQGAIQSVPVLSQVNLGGGALGAATSLIGALYINPPVRTADYLASVGQGLGLVKEAHAQGVFGSGQAVLNPVLALWQVSRNIAYLAMIIIFVIIGLMVMFRQRINPQTVITAQAALPGLVIGLILITFSYFFAALLSDVAFVGTNLVGFYFSAAQGTGQQDLVNDMRDRSALNIFSGFVNSISHDNIENAVSSVFDSAGNNVKAFFRAFAAVVAFQFGAQLGGAIPVYGPVIGLVTGAFAALITGTLTAQILGWVFWIISIAILIYTMLRLLLRLITAYLNIIFLTVTAPFHFLAGSLPGRQGIVTAWILNMLCHILAFPAVIGVFYFVAYLLGLNNAPFINVPATPAITGDSAFPLLGGMDLSFIRILLAFGALLATPTIPDIICRTIGRVTQAGQLIGQEIGGDIGGGRGYFNQFRGGIGGIGGELGRIPTQPGWIYENGEWRRVYDPRFGAQAGVLDRFRGLGRRPIAAP